MNQKLPYEQLIADKLRELNLPGREDAWQKMNGILDKEMPEKINDRKKGFGKWRNIGLVVLLLTATFTTTYLLQNQENSSVTVIQGEAKNNHNKEISVSGSTIAQQQEKAIVKNTLQADEHTLSTPGKNSKASSGINPSKANQQAYADATNKQITVDTKKKSLQFSQTGKNISVNKRYSTREDITKHNMPSSDMQNKPPGNNQYKKDISAVNAAAQYDINQQEQNNNKQQEHTPAAQNTGTEKSELLSTNSVAKDFTELPGGISASLATLEGNTLPELYQNSTLTVPLKVWQLPDVASTKKAILKEMKRQEKKQERELAKSYKTHWRFWGNQTDRWFAAGIAPFQNFTIASQHNYNYNSSAGKNIIADYIPSPYIQLHVTDRIYLLSEFQFNSPQATPNLLLAQNSTTIPMSNVGITENTYLKKLYYFNMPVSFYYSPVKNFYLGSGLQFSSFNSGLAYSEQRLPDNTILQSQIFKIKDDSLSSRISASEWRYLFDANYYVDRFMFGFRYNQALNNFVNLKVNNILPPTQARNQAFQFYIRYNLVVSKRN